MIRKFLKMNFLVEIEPCVVDGKGVWRATSPSLKMYADADTPDSAMGKLADHLSKAENKTLEDRHGSRVVKREEVKVVEPIVKAETETSKELSLVDLKLLGKTELKEYATKKGYVVTSSMSKQEVIEILVGHEVENKISEEESKELEFK